MQNFDKNFRVFSIKISGKNFHDFQNNCVLARKKVDKEQKLVKNRILEKYLGNPEILNIYVLIFDRISKLIDEKVGNSGDFHRKKRA